MLQIRSSLYEKNHTGDCCLVCSPAYADTNCPTVTKADIAALFEQWDQSLHTGKPSEVAKNYADDAILVPTVSNKVRHTHPEIEDYFQRFLRLKPDGQIEEQNIQIYCDVAVNSGIYTFAVVKDGQPSEVKARFTFVYRKVGDRWLIVDHHSSGMPEKTT
ncbi:MAG: SgcJ/EcaC family oxidoreductase [Leptolyngbyaceae cyanobacterium RM2_2_4]|nr:SgcJ/EcaC family oxidoreductase [Leptolyngbyaceae cyanobacterium SM1_4_3]NJO48795.1 SgcJ/EcaC family oxidoreductase [Leptolyngbyaceae cyanobacterium RM2_2_4]